MSLIAEDPDPSISRREDEPLVSNRATLGPAWKYFIDSIHEALPRPGSVFLLRLGNPFRVTWELTVVLFAVWNCFYVPFMVAFWPDKDSQILQAIDVLIDLVYIVDIGVYARSTYIDLMTGEEVLDGRTILKHYLASGKFAIDLISAVPVDVISQQIGEFEELQLLTVSKIVRVLRVSKLLMFLRTKQIFKLRVKLIQLVSLFIAYVHIVSCLWYLCISSNSVFIPPALYVDGKTDLYESSIWKKYGYSLYMAVYLLTAAEIGPRTVAERYFAGCAILSGQLFQGYMFGEIAVVLFNFNKKSSKMGVIQEASITAMANMHLDRHLQRKISNYLVQSQGSLLKQQETKEFFSLLPPSLLQEVQAILFKRMILSKSSIRRHPSAAQSILFRLGNMDCQPEETIIQQGEKSTCMFFVASGQCEVWVLNENRDSHKVRYLTAGNHFGEVGLLYSVLRTATVIATDYTSLAVLSQENFWYICERYPEAKRHYRASALKYSDEWKHFVTSVLRRCPYFRNVSLPTLRELLYFLPASALEPGSYLYRSGDIIENTTFLLSGKVVIYIPLTDFRLTASQYYKSKAKLNKLPTQAFGSLFAALIRRNDRFVVKFEMDYLTRGSVIGHNLMLLGAKSNMFVKTVDTTTILTMTKEKLEEISEILPEIQREVTKYRAMLLANMKMRPMVKKYLGVTDYDKSFALDLELEKGRRLWQAKMTLRRCAIGKLLEKREIRKVGFSELPHLSEKLKAYLEAERREDHSLAEKISKCILRTDFRALIKALELVNLTEVESPIVSQFALAASQFSGPIGKMVQELRGQMELMQSLETVVGDIEQGKSQLQKLIHLALQLRESAQMDKTQEENAPKQEEQL